MRQEKIRVYDICSLTSGQLKEKDFLAERFKDYLGRHSPALHLPHRHDFYHLVFFKQGGGRHTIEFTQFRVRPFEMYFMIPGQVHTWQFEGTVDGYIPFF